MISDSVSYTQIYIKGTTGYQNFVGYLNVIASQYETTGITVGSRHFGYNGQTEFITDTQYFVNPAPWTCTTNGASGNCTPDPDDYEVSGGGDTTYTADFNLVNTVLGTRKAYKAGTATVTSYWMASRYYYYGNANSYGWYVRYLNTGGTASSSSLYSSSSGSFNDSNLSYALRPIVTLASTLSYSGVGSKDFPMEIQ